MFLSHNQCSTLQTTGPDVEINQDADAESQASQASDENISLCTTLYNPIQSLASLSHDGSFSPEIRLLLLTTISESEDEFHGSLESFRLLDAPSFVAVSYEWEGPRAKLMMNSNLKIGNNTMPLKPNLVHALMCFWKSLRDPTYLWIDAICINQADIEERGQQVQLMSEIYQQARGVWIWLGPANHDSDLAMDVIDQIAEFPEDMKGEFSRPMKWIKRILHGSEYAAHRLALYSLFCRSYWNRLWIVQELVLGACTDAPMLWCGDRLSALGHVSKLARGIRAALNLVQPSVWRQNITLQKMERAIKVILDLADHIDEHSQSVQSRNKPNYSNLLIRYTGNQCTDPRDKIYALLGIARLRGARLQVDYTLPLEEVCQRTALYIIKTTERLDLLSSCLWKEADQYVVQTAPSPAAGSKESTNHYTSLDLESANLESVQHGPSWVPKWGTNLNPRLHPATKINLKKVQSIWTPDQINVREDGSIRVAALFCGKISETLRLWTKGTLSSEKEHMERLLQIVHRVHLCSEKRADIYSPRMVGERTTAALLYRILFLPRSKTSGSAEHPHIDRKDFIEWGSCFLRGTVSSVLYPAMVREFVEQPQRTLFLYREREIVSRSRILRKPIFDGRHGFGLSMVRCRSGDMISALDKCRDLILLRKQSEISKAYRVLGQCYSSTLDTFFDSGDIASRSFGSTPNDKGHGFDLEASDSENPDFEVKGSYPEKTNLGDFGPFKVVLLQ